MSHVVDASEGPMVRATAVKLGLPEIIFGTGMLRELGGATRRMGGLRAFVISDEGVMEAGWVDRALPSLRDAQVRSTVWHGITPNPKDHEVQAGVLAFLESECDAVVAVGGGSCIDAAKAIAVLSSHGGVIADYAGIDRVPGPIPPLVAAPSTAGSGADVSQFCVITDTKRKSKLTLAGRALVPNVSVVDPCLLSTVSDEVAAYTGLDALTHAVEAYVSRGANFLSDLHALHAMRIIAKQLSVVLDNPSDVSARVDMARASLLAGLAFGSAMLGATHAISHQIGGLLDLPHGLLNAVLLPHVIRFNAPASGDRYRAVAQALGVTVVGMDAQGAADACADAVGLLADKLGVPRGLHPLGVRPEHLPLIAQQALDDAYMTTNPRPVSPADVERICENAL